LHPAIHRIAKAWRDLEQNVVIATIFDRPRSFVTNIIHQSHGRAINKITRRCTGKWKINKEEKSSLNEVWGSNQESDHARDRPIKPRHPDISPLNIEIYANINQD